MGSIPQSALLLITRVDKIISIVKGQALVVRLLSNWIVSYMMTFGDIHVTLSTFFFQWFWEQVAPLNPELTHTVVF